MADAKRLVPPVTTSRLESIDGLRGVAALIVIAFHTFNATGASELRIGRLNVLRPIHDGWAGVNLFLVLSGFCLYWPFARRPDRRLELGQFAVKRVRRIIPAYYFALVAVPCVAAVAHRVGLLPTMDPQVAGPQGPVDVVLHLLLLHSLWWRTIWSWNSVTWSLGLEWLWYMVFPLAVWAFRRWGATRGLLLALLVTVAYRTAVFVVIGPSSRYPQSEIAYTYCWRVFVAGRLFEFAAGMYVAWVAAQGKMPRWAVTAGPLLVTLVLCASRIAERVDPILPVRDVLYGTAFAGLTLLAVTGEGTWVNRGLRLFPLVCVGEWSYSFYLLHMPVVDITAQVLQRAGLAGPALFFCSLTIAIPTVTAVAWASYSYVERPFIRSREGRVAEVFTDPVQAIAP